MSHDPYDLSSVPHQAITRARQLLEDAAHDMLRCSESGVAMGWWVESHTLGCRSAADESEEALWASHWAILEEAERNGFSRIMADESSGAFVTMHPRKGTSVMGAARRRFERRRGVS